MLNVEKVDFGSPILTLENELHKQESWLRPDTTIYHIFVGSFYGADSKEWEKPINQRNPDFLGGNLRGIIEKFEYIESLGVDAIWLSPFFLGTDYHGYHPTDLTKIDPHFGIEDDLKNLISLSRVRGLKVISDFIPNHVSSDHPFFQQALKDPESPYRKWFMFNDSAEEYTRFLHFGGLPKLNLDYPPAMQYVLGAARKWLDIGLDGFRIDHIIGLSNENIKVLVGTLRAEYPGRAFIGEALLDGVNSEDHLHTLRFPNKGQILQLHENGLEELADLMLYDNYYLEEQIHGVLNFLGTKLLERYANTDSPSERRRLKRKIIKLSRRYPAEFMLVTGLGDHDRERILYRCGGERKRVEMAFSLLADLEQPIDVYYGDEIGLTQKKPFSSRKHHKDLLVRQRMPWDLDNPDRPEHSEKTLKFFRKRIADRKG